MKHQSYVDRMINEEKEEQEKKRQAIERNPFRIIEMIIYDDSSLTEAQKQRILPFVGGISINNLSGLFQIVSELIAEAVIEDRKNRD